MQAYDTQKKTNLICRVWMSSLYVIGQVPLNLNIAKSPNKFLNEKLQFDVLVFKLVSMLFSAEI